LEYILRPPPSLTWHIFLDQPPLLDLAYFQYYIYCNNPTHHIRIKNLKNQIGGKQSKEAARKITAAKETTQKGSKMDQKINQEVCSFL